MPKKIFNRENGPATKVSIGELAKRLFGAHDGTAAIEFSILIIPYLMITFAILETFLAFTGEQMLGNAVETMSRKFRTGQITAGLGRPTDMTEQQFRAAFCNEISVVISCSGAEIATPAKLYLDVRSFNTYADIPVKMPLQTADALSDLDPSSFRYAPGGSGTINILRAYYRWQILTDLIRPYVTNIRKSDGSMPTDFLIVGTSAFMNEAY